VGEDGKQIGVIKTSEALTYAQERDLDLVEVAPDARPPVCRVLDYSKYKYEQAQKQKAARKHQQQITIREIKFRPKIAQNDYDTKKGHVKRFLLGRDRVKVTIMFRGREVTHPERGTALLDKLAGELSEIAVVEQTPLQDGRNMTMMLAPSKAVLAGEKDDKAPAEGDTPGGKGGREARQNGSERTESTQGTRRAAPTAEADRTAEAGADPSADAEADADASADADTNADADTSAPASSDATA
jgi:translation initiation factor IF-3